MVVVIGAAAAEYGRERLTAEWYEKPCVYGTEIERRVSERDRG